MDLGFTMEQAVVIYFILIQFILAAINIIYYNPMIVSIVQYFHEFSVLFSEHQFLSKYGMLKPVLGVKFIFEFLLIFENRKVRQHSVPFYKFCFLVRQFIAFQFCMQLQFFFFSLLEGSKTSCCFFLGSGSSRSTVSVSIRFGLAILGRSFLTFLYFLVN